MAVGRLAVLRRRAAAGLIVLALAVALATLGRGDRATETRSSSTLAATFVDGDGDGVLERGQGEPLRDRTELAPASRPRRELALLAQISDAHVRDEESPARASLLDRLGEPFTSTFRPHEALSTQTLAASVTAVNALHPQAVLETGDLIDSAQVNELEQALTVLGGGHVDPDSGARGYDGPQAASGADPLFYRPDSDAPRHPGLLERAQLSFRSPGLDAPWYPVLGNHDLLVQGEAPALPALRDLATGGRRLVTVDPDVRPATRSRGFTPEVVERLLANGLPGRTAPTPPDPDRRQLTSGELSERLRRASARAGGRATGRPGAGPRLDYSFDVGAGLRVVVLDLVRRDGGSDGLVGPDQVAWLRRELRQVGDRWVIVASHQPLTSSEGGERALAELDRSPRVVAAIAGHTHESSIEPRRSPAGGYWLVQTASLADHPQQARALRLVETGTGVALETWMLVTAEGDLADISRELAFLDVQGGRPQGASGEAGDRNARLYR